MPSISKWGNTVKDARQRESFSFLWLWTDLDRFWKGQNISFSIEDNQYYVLFKIIAGPEAVLRQPLEDMKVFECPEVLEFNQIFDLSRVSWLWVEIFLSPLSPFSPLSPHRPRMSALMH